MTSGPSHLNVLRNGLGIGPWIRVFRHHSLDSENVDILPGLPTPPVTSDSSGEAVGSGGTGQASFEEGSITRIFEHTNPGALGTGRPTRAIEAVCFPWREKLPSCGLRVEVEHGDLIARSFEVPALRR
jgi:hypothetical protein